MSTRRAAIAARGRRGLALAMVTIHAALILSAWALANRQTVDLVRLKEYVEAREDGRGHREAAARRLAVAYALALLETGQPPESPYECAADVDPKAGPAPDAAGPLTFLIRFESVPPPEPEAPAEPDAPPAPVRWTITVQKAADGAPAAPRPWRFPAPDEAPAP